MSEAFTFDFCLEDIQDSTNQADILLSNPEIETDTDKNVSQTPPVCCSLDELLSSLPETISYSIKEISSANEKKIRIPMRELFDIRFQLMENDNNVESTVLPVGIGNSDIENDVYEGGFKSWECSTDLAIFLLESHCESSKYVADRGFPQRIIELGCGSALPSLCMLAQYLERSESLSTTSCFFTLCDFNQSVLRLSTLPNLFLMFCTYFTTTELSLYNISLSDSSLFSINSPNSHQSTFDPDKLNGELIVTTALKSLFVEVVQRRKVWFNFISGSWACYDQFTKLISSSMNILSPSVPTIILASETIYTLDSIKLFSRLLTHMLEYFSDSYAFVISKDIYFGLTGDAHKFQQEVIRHKAIVHRIEQANLALGKTLMEVKVNTL